MKRSWRYRTDRTQEWPISLYLAEIDDQIVAQVMVDVGVRCLETSGEARRDPSGPVALEAGGLMAAGRALADLGIRLIELGEANLEAVAAEDRRARPLPPARVE